jgi:chromosomal replication initiation ATPase DnaA
MTVSSNVTTPPVLENGGSLGTVKRVVAEFYEVHIADIDGPSRKRQFLWPRRVAMYLARELTDHSYPEIGSSIGGRHHATVIQSERAVGDQIARSDEISSEVRAVKAAVCDALGCAPQPVGGGATEDSKGQEVPEW